MGNCAYIDHMDDIHDLAEQNKKDVSTIADRILGIYRIRTEHIKLLADRINKILIEDLRFLVAEFVIRKPSYHCDIMLRRISYDIRKAILLNVPKELCTIEFSNNVSSERYALSALSTPIYVIEIYACPCERGNNQAVHWIRWEDWPSRQITHSFWFCASMISIYDNKIFINMPNKFLLTIR